MPKTRPVCANSLTGVLQGPPSCTTHLDYSDWKKRNINIKSHSNLSQHPICQSVFIALWSMATNCCKKCKATIKTIVLSEPWAYHLMSCGHISSGWKTRILRRFSLALASSWALLNLGWGALPQYINCTIALWYIILGNLGDYQAQHLIIFHFSDIKHILREPAKCIMSLLQNKMLPGFVQVCRNTVTS